MSPANYADDPLWKASSSLVDEVFDASRTVPDTTARSNLTGAAVRVPFHIAQSLVESDVTLRRQELQRAAEPLRELRDMLHENRKGNVIPAELLDPLIEKSGLLSEEITRRTAAVSSNGTEPPSTAV